MYQKDGAIESVKNVKELWEAQKNGSTAAVFSESILWFALRHFWTLSQGEIWNIVPPYICDDALQRRLGESKWRCTVTKAESMHPCCTTGGASTAWMRVPEGSS